ncbi:MAG TPA: NAD-dependent 4,6-dehydratase LegB, partial [Clostridia bacterium]|nr:NAD-dependent 4,6-dehydratase LegB [Clostridia bacterium]
MDMKNKKVLVTGSEGFIGSHLVERLLEAGANVTAFVLYNSFGNWGWIDSFTETVKREINVVTGDIRDEYCIRQAVKGHDVVFHLAALIAIPYSYYSPMSYVDTNIKGTLNVMNVCRDWGTQKVIHTSTSETYGTAQYVPIDERHPLQGQSPYSASKIGADMIVDSYYRSFNVPVSTIRPFNTYGPRQSARAVIPTIITQILAGKKEIKLGSLTPTRDLNFIEDTVEGFIKIAESESSIGNVVNIGTGKEISIGDLAERIIKLTGGGSVIKCDEERLRPEKSEVNRLCADNRKAYQLAGWTPKYSLDEGLEITIEWFKKNLDKYKVD